MSRYCPSQERIVLYTECIECEEKACRTPGHEKEKQNKNNDSIKNTRKTDKLSRNSS